jgi:glycosyltransferase involved in cell wall biosynthesis
MRIGIDARKIADFGIGTYIRGLLHGLAGLEDSDGNDDEYVVFAPAQAGSLVPERFAHVALDAPHYSLRELIVVGRAAGRAGLDLLHSPHYVAPLTRVPLVVTVHDLIHLHQPQRNPVAPLYARMMLSRAVRRACRVLTVSESVAREIAAELGGEGKLVVTPNGIDHDVFRPDGPRAGGRYFLYAGNDKPHKNVDRLVEAFARLSGKGLSGEPQLVLAGAPFARFAARSNVICRGFVATDLELASLMRGAIALVQPSLEEGFGLPAAEAMACGVAVITSNAAALVEVTGEAALHADATSVDAIADAMSGLLADDSLRASLASRGVMRARDFTWSRCAKLTRAAYRAGVSDTPPNGR